MAELFDIFAAALLKHRLLAALVVFIICAIYWFGRLIKTPRFHQAIENALKAMHK